MKQNRYHLYLGIFVLTGVLLIGAAITILGAKALWEDSILMETYILESVSGLERGSPVKFRGITVGKVERITTVSRMYDTSQTFACVRFQIFANSIPDPRAGETVDQSLQEQLGRGMRVSLASAGVTGGSYLETEFHDPKTENIADIKIDWTPTVPYIPSVPSTMKSFVDSADKVLNNLAKSDVDAVLRQATATLKQAETSMAALDLAGLSQKANRLLEQSTLTANRIEARVAEVATAATETLDTLGKRVDSTLVKAETTLTGIDALLAKKQIGQLIDRLETLMSDADLAVQDVRTLARSADGAMRSVGQVVRGRSRTLGSALEELREVLQNLNGLTGTLREYPSLLFVGTKPGSETPDAPPGDPKK